MVQINDDYYEDLDENAFKKILLDIKKDNQIKKGSQIGRQTSHPKRAWMLKEKDKIFKNLYGFQDWTLKGAQYRGIWEDTKDLIGKGSEYILDEIKKSELNILKINCLFVINCPIIYKKF